jgi:NAD(P)-dependent dehydrogenase (short-subunit alcohol dehydrogenase family)
VPTSPDLTQRAALVTGAGRPLGWGLASALADAGARVAVTGAAAAGDDRLAPVHGSLATREDAGALLERARDALGAPVDVVVHADVASATPQPFSEVDDEHWDATWERTMRATLFLFQAAFPAMRERGSGRFVVVTPTLSMSGAAGLAPLAAAIEGQRLLAKSAARQWGEHGITVNCVAPGPEAVSGDVRGDAVSLAPPALGRNGDPHDDLGPIVTFLASDAGHFVTGVTLCADGGVWMAP